MLKCLFAVIKHKTSSLFGKENGEKMKKSFLLGIAVMVLSVFCLTACGGNQAPQYSLDVDFVVEPNPDFIGSYSTQRCDLNNRSTCWAEWGEWGSALELALDPNKEICLGNKPATLRARSDYEWIQEGNCFHLEKKSN